MKFHGHTSRIVFLGITAAVLSGVLSAPLALAAGLALALTLGSPCPQEARRWSKTLLQFAVVALGFGMELQQVLQTGRASIWYTAAGIASALAIGWLLGRLLNVQPKASFLVSAGTAICGGSAIAALAPLTEPSEEELAMSLGTVFTLNSIALFAFPLIGHLLHLSQTQFGLWSALAIHDTSSVVGASSRYGAGALAVGLTVKLTRALWIIPVALTVAALKRGGQRSIRIPLFILLFCIAAAIHSFLPQGHQLYSLLGQAGQIALAMTLFLIGTGMTRQALSRAGTRVLTQGSLLWIFTAGLSLLAICRGWIAL